MTLPATSPSLSTRDSKRTRSNILLAAQRLFAEKGYTTTGVREVAAAAGVNSTLIRRYFASKEGLFRAAVEEFLQVDVFLEGGREEFGKRAVTLLIYGEGITSALAMMMLATADSAARDLCSELMHRHITVPLADWLGGGPRAMARASQINMLWFGYMSARQVLPLTGLDGEALESARDWLADTIQAIVDRP